MWLVVYWEHWYSNILTGYLDTYSPPHAKESIHDVIHLVNTIVAVFILAYINKTGFIKPSYEL